MKVIKVYNVKQNSKYITATVDFKVLFGRTITRNIFFEPMYPSLMRYSDTNYYVLKDKTIHNEVLTILENE